MLIIDKFKMVLTLHKSIYSKIFLNNFIHESMYNKIFLNNCIQFYKKLSHLNSTFNYPYKSNQEAIQSNENVGLFEYKTLNNFIGFSLMKEDVFKKTKELIAEAISINKNRHIVQIFDDLSNTLCCVADMADCVRAMHPDAKWIEAADEACVSIGLLVERLNTDIILYETLKTELSQLGKSTSLRDDTDKLVGNLFLIDFEQSGIHLSSDIRSKFVTLSELIFKLSYSFSKNCYLPTITSEDNIAQDLVKYFPHDKGKISISSLYTDVHDRRLREASYKQYFKRNEEQERILENLLTARQNIARLVGFKSYAEKALMGSMTTPVIVQDFLCKLSNRIKDNVNYDLDTLNSLNRASYSQEVIKSWDVTYLIKQYRSNIFKQYQMTEQLISEYFTLGSCMQGLDQIFQHLYDVSLVVCDIKRGETWHEDVKKIFVRDQITKKTIGIIYCDFFERDKKPHQDCHFTIRGGRLRDDGQYQIPIVVLALNLRLQSDQSKPVLLSYSQVENLFHEFGHAMHSMLGSTRYQHVTGTRCTTDFAEVPSILMEYFVGDARIIKLIARHWKTEQSMPDDLIELVIKSKKCFQALEMQQQVLYSIMDQQFHSEVYITGSTMELIKQIHKDHSSISYTPDTAYHLRFSHFIGYGAKYYSYIWSRALAGLIWNKLFVDNPLSKSSGMKWRSDVLKYGGEKKPKIMLEGVLQQSINTDILVDSLVHEYKAENFI